MKTLLISTFLALGMLGYAQHAPHHKGMKDMSAEQIASLETKKLTLALDLSENQQQKIQELTLDHALKREAKREEQKAKDSKPDADERYDHLSSRLDSKIEMKAKMKEILNKEQFEKWEKLQIGKEKRGKCKSHKGKPTR
ncbi:MAG: hypothetical protein ABF293_10295 [Flavobacteriaceae bacterium]